MGRAAWCSIAGLERGPWTAKEDALLINYVQKHGEGQWFNVPKKTGLQRCGKSCRLRWMNYLRPDIKRGNFSPEEDDLIIRLHKLLGNRWSLIARRLPGRTDNEIKNYWNSHLSKRLLLQKSSTKTDQPKISTDSKKNKNIKTTPENGKKKEPTNASTCLQKPTRVFPFSLPITRNDNLDSMPSSSIRAANDTEALNSVTPPWSDPVVAGGDGEQNLFDHNVFDISNLQDNLLPTEEYHNMFNKIYAEYQELLMSSEDHIVKLDCALVDSFSLSENV